MFLPNRAPFSDIPLLRASACETKSELVNKPNRAVGGQLYVAE